MSIESVIPSNNLILCHPFLLCLQSFPPSGFLLMRQLFASGVQSIGASASASVLPVNIQDWFPLGLTGLISFQSKGLSRVFSHITVQKHQFFSAQPFLWSYSHIHTWVSSLSCVRLFVTPWTVTYQAPPSMGFSKQEFWSGVPFPSPIHESEVTELCPTLSDPMDCSLSGSSIHGILQALRVLEWGAIAFSVG